MNIQNEARAERTVGNYRVIVTVQDVAPEDTNGRPLPPLVANRVTMTWLEIGQRVVRVADEFVTAMTRECPHIRPCSQCHP